MKKTKILFILILIVFSFSSCTSISASELKNRLIIEGIGIDYDSENENYILTVQSLVTNHSSGSESKPEQPIENHTVFGKTIGQALSSLSETTGKMPLYSQNRVVILGESLSGELMIKALDHFAREYTSRADIRVAASSGDASDILSVHSENGEITAKLIEDSLLESYNNSVAVNTQLFNIVNLSLEENTCFTIPLLEVTDERKLNENVVKVTGTFVYGENGEKNCLSSDETMFYQLIMNNAENGAFGVNFDGVAVGFNLINAKTKIKTSAKGGIPEYTVNVKMAVDIKEYDSVQFGALKRKDIQSIENTASEYFEKGISDLLDRELKKEKSDIFRFGRRFMQLYPSEYRKIADDWTEVLPQIKCYVNVETQIRRIGQESMKNF